MAGRYSVFLVGAILFLGTYGLLEAQRADIDPLSLAGPTAIVATSGYGRFSDDSTVNSLLITVHNRLSEERCASLFGGVGKALDLLTKTSVNYVNASASNLPERPAMFPGRIWEANVGLGIERLKSNESWVYARAYPADGSSELRGVIFLNDNFLRIAIGRDTAFLHELMHVNGAGAEIDTNYSLNYTLISSHCGSPAVVLARPMAVTPKPIGSGTTGVHQEGFGRTRQQVRASSGIPERSSRELAPRQSSPAKPARETP